MLIDCDSCVMRPKACGDCVVSFLLSPTRAGDNGQVPEAPVELHTDEQHALEVLASSGLVPPLRLATSEQARPAAHGTGVRRAG